MPASLAGEVDCFLVAAEARFGADEMRAFNRGGVPERPMIADVERAALSKVARLVQALRGAERAAAVEEQRLAASLQAGQGAGLKL